MKTYLVTAIAAIVITIGLIGYFRLRSENKALNRALDHLQDSFVQERARLDSTARSLELSLITLRETDLQTANQIEELRRRKADLDQISQHEKDRIASYTADSLERFFARRYR